MIRQVSPFPTVWVREVTHDSTKKYDNGYAPLLAQRRITTTLVKGY